MNTKRFLVIAVLVVLLVSALSLVTTIKSTPAKAQVQANEVRLVLVNEPTIRMQSGEIHFSDSNSPDFSPHTDSSEKEDHDMVCIPDETATLRRFSGCVE